MAAPAKEMLRFIACGSVDAGKSTLIERLLFDCKTMSCLHAEREQGIPIGVAYRHFETASRKFILADTSSHEQNTRHMVAGADDPAEVAEVGVVALELDRQIAFDARAVNRATGGFTLIDRLTHHTVATGMLHFGLRRSHNVRWQAHAVKRAARSSQKGQRACAARRAAQLHGNRFAL